ncbi:MAG: peptidylprolyl isomerase [Acidobacteria bacterium]|nr:peptidylprolyl isomerase [Acidobacteriota bacterium]
MKNLLVKLFAGIIVIATLSLVVIAQKPGTVKVSDNDLAAIVKAEDELRFDKVLVGYLNSPNPVLQQRAALAAGRIGDEAAIPALEKLLVQRNPVVSQMVMFALGEIESVRAADPVLKVLGNYRQRDDVRASAVEAAGKIAAANPKEDAAKELGQAILSTLEFEAGRRSAPSKRVILLGATAVLRAKPENADEILVRFLGYSDWRIRADVLNTLARLRSKAGNEKAAEMLKSDKDPIVRANAARILGSSDDKSVLELLISAATSDSDSRVRINAIRSLGVLKDPLSVDQLLGRAAKLAVDFKRSDFANPSELNELLTIYSSLGSILKGTNDSRALNSLKDLRIHDRYQSPELEIAFAQISPDGFVQFLKQSKIRNDSWKQLRSFAAGMQEFSKRDEGADEDPNAKEVREFLKGLIADIIAKNVKQDLTLAIPDLLGSYAAFKPEDLKAMARQFIEHKDIVVRATAAGILGEIKPTTPQEASASLRVLSDAYWTARTDKQNDAQLALLEAMKTQYENRPANLMIKIPYVSPIISAIGSPDYLVRRKAAEIYRGFNIPKPDPMTVGNPNFKPFEIPDDYRIVKFDQTDKNGARSRVVRADYKTAVSRKNGQWKAMLSTEKGNFTIDLRPEDAPLTVDNFIKLAKSGYFNGLEIHRVVPNFVMQDGDPRGDGNGGPGWQIRCEINQLPYERGAVGMALSGKDTGGSQWFVTLSRQPHLDGGYTVFGNVNETDMNVVDLLVRGDKILKVEILMD